MEDIIAAFSNLKDFMTDDFQPWKEFLGVFKPPQPGVRHVEQRVSANFEHYKANYLIICLVFLGLRIILNPVFLITLVLTFAFAGYALFIYKQPLVIGTTTINDFQKTLAVGVISFLLFWLSGTLEALIWSILYCLIFCGMHMIFRPCVRKVAGKPSKPLYDNNVEDPESGSSYGSDADTVRKRGSGATDRGTDSGASMMNPYGSSGGGGGRKKE